MTETPAEAIQAGKSKRADWLLLLCRLLVSGVFLLAAWQKIDNPFLLSGAITGFKILHDSIALEMAVLLIWLEIIGGLFLLVGLWSRGASLVLCGLLSLFLIALASALLRGLNISCGCFGALFDSEIGITSLIRTVALFTFAALVLRFGGGALALDNLITYKTANH